MTYSRDDLGAAFAMSTPSSGGDALVVTNAEMQAAYDSGDAVALAQTVVPWLVRYRDAWWVQYEDGWLLITDQAVVTELDRATTRMATADSVRDSTAAGPAVADIARQNLTAAVEGEEP
jgi:hypothetical protein